jgi:hypothetical protein
MLRRAPIVAKTIYIPTFLIPIDVLSCEKRRAAPLSRPRHERAMGGAHPDDARPVPPGGEQHHVAFRKNTSRAKPVCKVTFTVDKELAKNAGKAFLAESSTAGRPGPRP